ncbi:MAG: alpha/beta hydrolase [Bacteroidetes bacterium]|nr:alpha/beta hydrolase [Bacteroidota bacterium]
MLRHYCTILLIFVYSVSLSQTVRFKIKSLPANHINGSSVYLAASFNGWNPKDEKHRFRQDEKGFYYLQFNLAAGIYEYKLTRGGWDKVESRKNGTSVENRRIQVEGNTIVELTVEAWHDQFSAKPRVSTAGKNVRIADTAFFIPQLNRKRRVWVYLPENYYTAPKNYRWPVLYMHDGQNVFDDATSFAGEWGVDEFLDTAMIQTSLVVAIDNGGDKRLNEYCPYDFSVNLNGGNIFSGKGEGNAYVDFIAQTLKPYVDKTYRTKKDRQNTSIAGSSMGGLISLYAILKYPKVFGAAGVFSPAFWVAPNIFDDIKTKGKKVKARVYFYAGKQESESMVPDMLKVLVEMMKVSASKMTTVIRDDGKHNEPAWRKEFPLFYYWIFR